MSQVHSIKSGDGTICLVVDGTHYTVSLTHPAYSEIDAAVTTRPIAENKLRSLLNINERIASLQDGKVRVDLDAGKVWFNDTEFKDGAFCRRILRLMAEGHDVQYLVNFLKRVGENPEFRAVMETFRFLQHSGLPITPDGCFLAYKGVRSDYYDKWTGTILNMPDGRRVEEKREVMNNNPSHSCAKGLHCGTVKYGQSWGAGGHCVLVKVDPKDVVCVPNHDCEKMRVCGYWVIKDFDDARDHGISLKGEVYSAEGTRMEGSKFTDEYERGMLDHDTNSHWDDEEGREYGNDVGVRDDIVVVDCEVDDENDDLVDCNDCGELVEDCTCDDFCPDCQEDESNCYCN